MGKQSIVRFFLVFTGATLCVIAAASTMLAVLRAQSLRSESEHTAGEVSTGALASALSREAGGLTNADLSSFSDAARGLIGDDIVAIRLWAPDGTLLAEAGDGAAPQDRGALTNAIISGLGTTKAASASGDVLASYAPLVPGAVLEVQQRYGPIDAAVTNSTSDLLIQLLVGGLLVALLLPVVLWVSINGLINEYGRLVFLHRTGQSIRETLDVIDMLVNFSRDVVTYTGAQIGLAALVEEATGDIVVKASYDGLGQKASHHYRKVEEWYLRRCVGTADVVRSKESELPYETLLGYDPTMRGKVNVLCVPIPGRERVAGLIMLVRFAAQGPFRATQVQMVQEMAALAAMAIEQTALFSKVRAYAEEVEVGYDSTLKVLTAALDTKDTVTQGHSERVARLTVMLAREVGVANEQLVDIERGALLHDVGKIGVPDHVLQKPASLDDDEWEKMQKHPLMAGLMVSKVGFLENAVPILIYHHERFDGGGYPFGLEGRAIPLEARIFTVVDAYDAMTSDRPYRLAMTSEDAMAEIIRNSGTQFDPEIVEAFIRVIERIYPSEQEAA
jgi:HD-GYP domain-containing protein (c-di-GMP phosphodiesterase class II)